MAICVVETKYNRGLYKIPVYTSLMLKSTRSVLPNRQGHFFLLFGFAIPRVLTLSTCSMMTHPSSSQHVGAFLFTVKTTFPFIPLAGGGGDEKCNLLWGA